MLCTNQKFKFFGKQDLTNLKYKMDAISLTFKGIIGLTLWMLGPFSIRHNISFFEIFHFSISLDRSFMKFL